MIPTKEIRNQSTIEPITLSRVLETLDVHDLTHNFGIAQDLAVAIVKKRDSLCFIGVERICGFLRFFLIGRKIYDYFLIKKYKMDIYNL